MNANVPGHRVSSKYWEENQQLPKVESELVAWGFDRELVEERIIALLKMDPEGAYQYLEALGFQGDAQALPIILRYVTDTNQFWRKAAVLALGNLKTDDAPTALEKALPDPFWEVRLHAIESLQKIGDPRSIPALLGALKDENPLIARASIPAIARLGDDSAAPPLIELLKSSDDETRKTVSTCPPPEKRSVRQAIERIEKRISQGL